MQGTSWSDEVDEIIAGDLTAALAYVTPAGGAVVTAVAPIGLRDREAGTVSFTTSLGFGKKLERIGRNPRVALAYHSREHGFASEPDFVLVQGDATAHTEPDRRYLEDVLGPQSERFMGPPRRGRLFWDRWLQEYYGDRVPVAVRAARVIDWRDDRAAGEPAVFGLPLPTEPAPPQAPPTKGTGPRLDAERAGKRLGTLPNQLLAFVGADGYPEVVPVEVTSASAEGIALRAERSLPRGGRRAGLLAHSYRAHLVGLATRGHTGWMSVGDDPLAAVYAPHTAFGFRAPSNKTLLLLANGLLAKRGLRRARRRAASA
jgi:Pyridoxamine 5'-phosphate oxidase